MRTEMCRCGQHTIVVNAEDEAFPALTPMWPELDGPCEQPRELTTLVDDEELPPVMQMWDLDGKGSK
jgi:hypothetical protein